MLGKHPAGCACVACQNQRDASAEYLKETAAMDSLTESVVARLEGGTSREEIVDHLVDAGVEPEAAAAFVVQVDAARRQAKKDDARGSLVFGFVLVAVGGGITAFTYSVAAPGGAYIVTWGVILWGLWKVGSGLLALVEKR